VRVHAAEEKIALSVGRAAQVSSSCDPSVLAHVSK